MRQPDRDHSIDVEGGAGSNLIDLNGVTTAAFTGLTSVTVDAGAGNDEVRGSQIADDIGGGEGDDRLVAFTNPQGSRDLMAGGEGDDTLVWNPGDGDDTMDGQAGSDTAEVNGGNVGEQFEVQPSAVAGRVRFDRTGPTPPGPFNLDIGTTERLDLNANGGDDRLDALAGLAALIALDLDGGAGDDAVQARNGAADQVSCGTDSDSVVADARDSVAADCEIVDRGEAGQPGGGAGQPDADEVAPVAAIARRAVRVNVRRRAAIRVSGADDEDSRVTLVLRREGRLLGRAARDIPAGEARAIRVKLSRKAFALLKRRGTLRVRAIATAEDEAGNRAKSAVWITLRSPDWRR